ncbi:MAG: hypothetical protein RLZZ116_2409 [Planctomycetota bacterium]|jgi:hypothetical protein
MSLTKTVGFVAVTTLAIGGAAFGAEQNNDALAQIAELKAQIAELKGAQGSQWLTEQRAAEIRGIVTDVLADSETRSSLQGASGSGYNGGFFLSSSDGNFSMKINVLEQIRWTFNNQEDANNEQVSGFENKRTRLTFSGNMVDSSWSYRLGYYLGYSNSNEPGVGEGDLGDASVAKDFGNGFSVTVGQFRLPFSAEYAIDTGMLQFNDYSVANTVFNAGYGQGLMIGYSADAFRFGLAYVNELADANQAWGSVPSNDWAFSGRAEFKFSGDWAQFNDAQSWKGEGMGAKVGIGYASEQDNANGTNPYTMTIDGTVDFGGANIAAAYYSADDDAGTDGTGFTVGGGVFVTDDFEAVLRYENIEDAFATELNTLVVGGNWYLAKNTAKLGLEFGYSFDAIPGGAEYAGWVDSGGEDGEWLFQAQLSFNF